MSSLDLFIAEDGQVQSIYSDTLAEVFEGETLDTQRASHVEPHPSKGGWVADMTPTGEEVLLGANGLWYTGAGGWDLVEPFRTRQAALDAEVAWLTDRLGERTL